MLIYQFHFLEDFPVGSLCPSALIWTGCLHKTTAHLYSVTVQKLPFNIILEVNVFI